MEAMNRGYRKPSSLTSISLGALLGASFVLAYFPVWKNLVTTWYSSDDYSHGFFIVPICLYIIWQKKKVLANTPSRPSRWGLLAVVFSLFLYLFAFYAEIVTLSSLSIILFLGSAVVYVFGFGLLREVLFPLLLLLFMIPVPAQIYTSLTIPLQLFVSKLSAWLTSLAGLPVYREGNVIILPEHRLKVVQACSGLRSMVALLTISAVYGYFTLRSTSLRGILFVSGIPAAIIVNIFRVLILLLAFEYFDTDLTHGTPHTALGIIVFALALAIVAATKEILGRWDTSHA